MYLRQLALCLAAAAICLSGCHNGHEGHAAHGKKITSNTLNQAAGVDWHLTRMRTEDWSGEVGEAAPSMRIGEDGRISGRAWVNQFFAEIRVDKAGKVEWATPIGTTRKAGPPELMSRDAALLEGLAKVDRMVLDEGTLAAESADGQTQLVFVAK